jgi:hypothetical protein
MTKNIYDTRHRRQQDDKKGIVDPDYFDVEEYQKVLDQLCAIYSTMPNHLAVSIDEYDFDVACSPVPSPDTVDAFIDALTMTNGPNGIKSISPHLYAVYAIFPDIRNIQSTIFP